MKVETFGSAEDFRARAPRLAAAHGRRVCALALDDVRKRWEAYSLAISPVGGSLTRDRHPGLLKRSWGGSGKVTATGVAVLFNRAPYATIIDRGRRRGITPIGAKSRVRQPKRGKKIRSDKRARMLGSKQAPQGITKPTWKRIRAEREAISAKAIAAAERGV